MRRRERHRLFLVVRHDDEGHAELLLQIDQLELRVLAQLLVERAERLVEQQQLRTLHQRARERDALALAAGQLVRLALRELRQLHEIEHVGDARRRSRAFGRPSCFRPNATFCSTRHVREQRVRLEHHVDRPLVRRDAGHVDAVDGDAPGGRLLEPGQHAQQRGLAAARAAEQAEQLAAIDLQRDVVDGDEVAELLRDAVDVDVGRRLGVVPDGDLLLGPVDRSSDHRLRDVEAAGHPRRPPLLIVRSGTWSTSGSSGAGSLRRRRATGTASPSLPASGRCPGRSSLRR